MLLTINQHLTMAWVTFALFAIFALRYGSGKREHPHYDQGLLIGFLITAGVTFWPLTTVPQSCRFAAILPLGATVAGLAMIGCGNLLERANRKARIPNDSGGRLVGNGGGVAIAGLLFGLALFTVAAFFIGAATFLNRDKAFHFLKGFWSDAFDFDDIVNPNKRAVGGTVIDNPLGLKDNPESLVPNNY